MADFGELGSGYRLDLAGDGRGYLLIGNRGTPIKLSASGYRLLEAVGSGVGLDTLAERYASRGGRSVTAAEVKASYERLVGRLAALERARSRSMPPGFLLRRQLFSRATVQRLADPLSALFAPRIAWAGLAAIGIALASALGMGQASMLEGASLWPGYALFLLSLLFHELGHASACTRHGAPPSDIGFAIYGIFPALYSDVTSAWQLDRRRRVLVDVGGAYFQLLVGAVYWAAYQITDWMAFQTAFLLILVSCLFSLNPIFKFDGYWVLADALGVSDLSRQPTRLLAILRDRLRGRPAALPPWPRWVKAVLLIYTPASFLFWLYFIVRLAPEIWARVLSYPGLLVASVCGPPDFPHLGHLASSTFLLLVCGTLIWRLARRLTVSRRRSPAGSSAAPSPA